MKWISLFLAIAIFGGVAAIVAGAVQGSVTACASPLATNNANGVCVNSTGQVQAGLGGHTAEYNATTNGLSGILNFTTQLGSAGTIAGLSVLVLAAVMILGYFGYRRNLR